VTRVNLTAFPRDRLAAPGPVEVPPAVLQAIAQPVIHHRTDAFAERLLAVRPHLAEVAGVPDDVVLLPGNGTIAFEALFLSTVPEGMPVVSVHAGKFGERWAALARRHGHAVTDVTAPWGERVEPQAVADAVIAHGGPVAVTLVHSETSTGVLHDVQAQAAAVRAVAPDAVVLVDVVTSLGVTELRPEAWGFDGIAAGSQKGLLLPPGLGFVWMSSRLADADEVARTLALDVRAERKQQRSGKTATTPPVNLIAGLEVALTGLLRDGVETLWARRKALNDALLAAGQAAGLTAYAQHPSPAVAALQTPEGLDAREVTRALAARGVRVGGGQGTTAAYVLRPSALGWTDEADVYGVAGLLEAVLSELGVNVTPGAATAAAQTVLANVKLPS
jgi:aspartate aminotransferase-like enzyme